MDPGMVDAVTPPESGFDDFDLSDPQIDHLLAVPGGLLAESAADFEDLLRQVVARVVGDGPAAEQALAEGGFVMDGCTLALRRNPDNDFIEVFCDVGQPDPHFLDDAWRLALELNLMRTYPGLTLGLHPESGRLIATLQTHFLLLGQPDACITLLETLVRQVRRLRESRVIPLL